MTVTDTGEDQPTLHSVVRKDEVDLRTLFDAIPVALYVFRHVEGDFVLTAFNPAGERFARVELAARIGMQVSELFPNTPQVLENLSQCFAERITLDREIEVDLEAGGEPVWLAFRYVFVPPDMVLVHAEGITLLKRAEEALHQQGARLRALFNAPTDTIAILAPDGMLVDINESGARRFGATVAALVGVNIYDTLPGPLAASRRAHMDGVFDTGTPVSFEDVRAGRVYRNHVYPILGEDGGVAQVAIFASDITQSKRAEAEQQRLHEQLQRQAAELERRVADRTRELSALYDIAAIAGENLQLTVMLERTLACVLEAMDCPKGAIHLVEEVKGSQGDGELQVAVQRGFSHDVYELGVLRSVRSELVEKVWLRGETVNEPGPLSDPAAGVAAYLGIPLLAGGKRLGVLGLARAPEQPPFDTEDVALLTSIGQQVAQAVENARLRAEASEAAVAAERNRLANELHDAVTQVLFSTSLIAETLPQVWSSQPEKGRQALAELRRLTQGALAEMRALLLELRPAALIEQDLDALIQQLVRGMMARTHMPITTTVVSEGELPVEVKLAAYRIAQEALNNVTKHAKASHATVYLQYDPRQVLLYISDDGCGFDLQEVAPDSLGLSIMRERAAAIGADFRLQTDLGQGTEVTLEWAADVWKGS